MTEKGNYLWIRAVSFTSLRELIYALSLLPNEFRAKQINEVVQNNPSIITQKGVKPSPTTLYHYRNILLNLGIFLRNHQIYSINYSDNLVNSLVNCLEPGVADLTPKERKAWGEIILRPSDCRKNFFDLFMSDVDYNLEKFTKLGSMIAWKPEGNQATRSICLYSFTKNSQTKILQSEDDIQAILYGIRYWARNEVKIIDEFYLEDLGGVMYPIEISDENKESQIITFLTKKFSQDQSQWLTFSVREMLLNLGLGLRLPVSEIHMIIKQLHYQFPEFIVFIPTAKSFATITASSKVAEKYQLRGYFQDEKGRLISHIRIHKKLLEEYYETKR